MDNLAILFFYLGAFITALIVVGLLCSLFED